MRKEAQDQRRENLLRELAAVGCDHTTGLAQMVDAPLSTTRRDLEALAAKGVVVGINHDERDRGGRKQTYWSLVK